MKSLFLSIVFLGSFLTGSATELTPSEAMVNPASVERLVLEGNGADAAWLVHAAPELTSLQEVIISGVTDDLTAMNLVSSVAACNNVRAIRFRNCVLQTLPANLRMLTQVRSFASENTTVADGEQFYNAIADMFNVTDVSVTGSDFRSLPKSFSRLRVVDNIHLFNTDVQLASGYDRNTKTPDELRASQSVEFGFGEDALHLDYACYNSEAVKSHVQMFRDVLQGSYRASNIFYNPVSTHVFTKQHPLVKPPVNDVDIYPDVYSVNSLTGSVLEYGSGTRIIVPALAFEDADGNPVNGNVDITYREFRDPVDIVLSGIPMQYDSGGVVGDFESAGMFEMEASQNGSEVFLREAKEVELKFAVTDTASNYNFYRLDENAGWRYLESAGSAEQDNTRYPGEAVSSEAGAGVKSPSHSATFAVNMYCNSIRNIRVRNWIRDTTDFDKRYNDTGYSGMNRIPKWSNLLTPEQKATRSSRLYLRKCAGDNNYTVLSLRNVEGNFMFNSELSAYDAFKWKIEERMSDRSVEERFGAQSGINDCRIIQDGSNYFIELKYYWGFDRIKAEPVRLDGENNPVAISEEQKEASFDLYTKRLNNRRKHVNHDNAMQTSRQHNQFVRAHNDSLGAWDGLKKVMTDSERNMDFVSWNNYVRDEKPFATITVAATNFFESSVFELKAAIFYQRISIASMGIHNFDRLPIVNIDAPLPRVFISRVVNIAGAYIVPAIIYVVDKVRNRTVTFNGGIGGGVRAYSDPTVTCYLLITDKEGNLYKVPEEEFTAANPGSEKEVVFIGELISGPGSTAETVRQAIAGENTQNTAGDSVRNAANTGE